MCAHVHALHGLIPYHRSCFHNGRMHARTHARDAVRCGAVRCGAVRCGAMPWHTTQQYFMGFGMGAAPDDPVEFAGFVGDLIEHLV